MKTPEIITTVILACVTLGIAIPFMLKAYFDWKATRETWKQLVGLVPFNFVWRGKTALPFTEEWIVVRLNFALECIATPGPWSRVDVLRAATGVNLIIVEVDKWTNRQGVEVSGQTIPEMGDVQVGPQMRALCHELCHVLLYRLHTGEFDDNHSTFEARGFNRAEAVYLGTT